MKSLKYLAAAALTLLAVGCNKEQVTKVPDGQMVDVTFTAALPGEMETKALGDGQTAKTLHVSVYENNAEKTKLDLDKTATFTDLKTQVTFSLVKGKTYNFVFWAQAEGATCYNIDDLKNIKISYEGAVANDETRDAFYATRKELKVNGALTETIKLYRPFAQVNFGTADLREAAAAGFVPKQSVFTATDVANVFDTFNAEGKVEGLATDKVTFAAAGIPVEPLVIKDGTKYAWMTMNYIIPVGKQGEKHISNVTAEFIPEAGDAITASSPQTPVQNNYRTNILGNLLTSQVIFNVEIVPIFNEPDNDIDIVNVKDEASLRALFATGGEAKLAADLVLDESMVVKAGKEVVLDLNGKTVSNTADLWNESIASWSLLSVRGGSLTIKGAGTLQAKENDCFAVDVQDGGTVVIEDGTYVGNVHAVYVYEGTAEIKGGKYSIQQLSSNPDPYGYVLNCYDKNRENGIAKIIVTGGEFVKFNPADCAAEGAHTNFLAAGYKSTQIGDSYFVTKAGVTPVANQEGFEDVISNGSVGTPIEIQAAPNSTIVLKTGLAHEGVKARNITIVGNGSQTVDVISGSISAEGGMLSYQRGSSFTFKNLKIKAGEGNFDGVVCDELVFENCTITGKFTLFGKASFKDCVFENTMADQYSIWTWGGTDVTFDKCTFNTNGKAILLYGQATAAKPTNLVVKNCILNDRNNGSAGKAAIEIGNDYNATYSLTIANCTVNGFAEGKNTGSKLWANKNSMNAAHLSVTIDGTKVQ